MYDTNKTPNCLSKICFVYLIILCSVSLLCTETVQAYSSSYRNGRRSYKSNSRKSSSSSLLRRSSILRKKPSVLFDSFMSDDPITDPCIDEKTKKPVACLPDFVNAAYGLPVEASSTCGEPPRQFCASSTPLLSTAQDFNRKKKRTTEFGGNSLPL